MKRTPITTIGLLEQMSPAKFKGETLPKTLDRRMREYATKGHDRLETLCELGLVICEEDSSALGVNRKNKKYLWKRTVLGDEFISWLKSAAMKVD